MENTFTVTLTLPFDESVEKVRAALAKQGFGIITEVDVKATIKKKLNKDFKNYVILGACNPQFAHRAIEADDNVGLLLPCNVIVYENGDNITVSTMKPTYALSLLTNETVHEVGTEAEKILELVFNDLNA